MMYTLRGSWLTEQVITNLITVKCGFSVTQAVSAFFFFFPGLDFYGYIKLINFVRLKVSVPCNISVADVWRM